MCYSMLMSYDPHKIEKKWQAAWEELKSSATPEDQSKSKQYILDMFPYPSGDGMHIGHVRIYTASDIVARMKRMQNFAVLHPTGWDAFGLPTENYAIKTGVSPAEATEKNVSNIRRQMKELGFSYDWDREVNTTDPTYYKWTQWIFVQMFKAGLAYEAEIPINWCPKDKTGLANEEVINGRCDRCGTTVEKRLMKQWVLKITDYAERLLNDLDSLDWPEKIKLMQRNWIGRSEGASVKFQFENDSNQHIEIFTTRPDTLFGATYMVLAPEHLLVDSLVTEEQRLVVDQYIQEAQKKSEIERSATDKSKTGVFTGAYAINPVNNEKIPIWVADYVLMGYGTGAIMAVPAHDERDWAFAKKYDLPIKAVIHANRQPAVSRESDSGQARMTDIYSGEGTLINSGGYNDLTSQEARKKIVYDLHKKGLAESKIQYKLRDWVFSRQRYWGEPIPIVHCKNCGTVAVPEDQLPIELPKVEKYQPTGTGESPLASVENWVNVNCPNCNGPARRETNTMPQWAGSCWYYLRFIDPHNNSAFADQEKLKHWLPVDIYLGGAEHAVLHLLYARFWHKFLFDHKLVPTNEPFQRLESVGIVLSNAYKDEQGHYVHNNDVVLDGEMAFHKTTGQVLTPETEKMSKSKGNVVSPDALIEKYGADVLRVYAMFLGPWDEMSMFDIQGMEGANRFLKKARNLLDMKRDQEDNVALEKIIAQTVIKVTDDIEHFHFNTAVSQLMILANHFIETAHFSASQLKTFVQLLAPFAPHSAEEMWEELGGEESVFSASWPTKDEEKARETEVTVVIQVNGTVRGRLTVTAGLSKDEIIEHALADANVKRNVSGTIRQTIFIPDKLINFVLD